MNQANHIHADSVVEIKNPKNIQNPYLKNLRIFIRMIQRTADLCLEQYDLAITPDVRFHNQKRKDTIKTLKKMGMKGLNDDMSFYVNGISPACLYCKQGYGPTVSPTYQCTRNCFYCFQPRPQGRRHGNSYSVESGGHDNIEERLAKEKFDDIINLAISGGEPLLALPTVLRYISIVKARRDIPSFVRLYTNGDLITKSILKKLCAVGLDEIRFGIKAGDFQIFEQVKLAMDYIPRVLMEGPVFPDGGSYMKRLLVKIDRLGIFGVNLLDLRCRFNMEVFKKRAYQLQYKEFRPFYEEWEYQGWPIAGSEDTIFDLLHFTMKEGLSLSVHYCPVRQNIQVTHRNTRKIFARRVACHTDAITSEGLLEKLVVYPPHVQTAMIDLKKHGVSEDDIRFVSYKQRLETHVRNLKCLNLKQYEVGCVQVLPGGEEVSIKVLRSKSFCRSKVDGSVTKEKINLTEGQEYLGSFWFRIYNIKKSCGKPSNLQSIIKLLDNASKLLPRNEAIRVAVWSLCNSIYESKAKSTTSCKRLLGQDVHILLGFCYESVNCYCEAIRQYKKSKQIQPTNPLIYEALFRCYQRIKNVKSAAQQMHLSISQKYRLDRSNGREYS